MIKHTVLNQNFPVFEFDLSEMIDTKDLANFIIEYKKNTPISRESSIRAWHSGFFIHKRTNKFEELISYIENCAHKAFLDLATDYDRPVDILNTKFKVLEAWLTVYHKFDYAEKHTHHPMSLSAVFYIDGDDSSPIVFGDYEIRPKTGKLLVFYGLLEHRVKPVLFNNKDRIAFVCNLYPFFDLTEITEIGKNVEHEKNYDKNIL